MWLIRVDSNIVSGLYAIILDILFVWIVAKVTAKARDKVAATEIDTWKRFRFDQVDLPGLALPVTLTGKRVAVISLFGAITPLLLLAGGFAINGVTVPVWDTLPDRKGVVLDTSELSYEFFNSTLVRGSRVYWSEETVMFRSIEGCSVSDGNLTKAYSIIIANTSDETEQTTQEMKDRMLCLWTERSKDLYVVAELEPQLFNRRNGCDTSLGTLHRNLSEEAFLVGPDHIINVVSVETETGCSSSPIMEAKCIGSRCLTMTLIRDVYQFDLYAGVSLNGNKFSFTNVDSFAAPKMLTEPLKRDEDASRTAAAVMMKLNQYPTFRLFSLLLFTKIVKKDWNVITGEQNATEVNVGLIVGTVTATLVIFLIICAVWMLLIAFERRKVKTSVCCLP